jgi:two-component system chemotaxis sensor kinase CheA
MSFDADDEILQDFIVEASEILEQLSEQLVDLEQQPDDKDLLNAIFRGFHTVKGGAGFLSITPLVELCHVSEDVFNILRQGQRTVTSDLMDAVLQALDVVNEMMDQVRDGQEPDAAPAELLQQLQTYNSPEQAAAEAVAEAPAVSEPEVSTAPEETVQQEPEPAEPAAEASAAEAQSASDEITEEEFEALLDQLHGAGKFGGAPAESSVPATPADPAPQGAAAGADADEITEDEFEALLDQLHGKGKFDAAAVGSTAEDAAAAAPPPANAEAAKPAQTEVSKPKPEAKAEVPKPQTAEPKPEPAKAEPAPSAKAKAPADTGKAAAKAPAGEATVRVDTQRLDDIMNMVGELVLVRNRLSTLKATMADEALANAVGNLDVVTADLQLAVMKTRMQPVKKVFGRFPRVVRDLARNLKKEIDLVMYGEETDLDKNLVEALADPLVHLVRNAVDHGIESPDEREAAGKPRKGTVVLSAAQEGDHILLSIEDDGKGMDPDVLRHKAVEKGLMDEEAAARLDDKDCYNLIFAPGFSTKTEISDVSGRGVGMDVVKTRISQMNGTVEIDSAQGEGSKLTIKLPLTLAILPTLMVVLGNQPFALPLASVVEIFNLDLSRTNTVDGQLTIRMRNRALPLFYLRQWLVRDGALDAPDYSDGSGHVVVVNVGGAQVGLVVDHLVGQEEVVIKPLGALLQGLDGMAGATITGDGKIALILDVPGLMRKYAKRF